jgi:Domain of unknown function (DUF4440)/Domain of unknown function (DUF6265)
MRKSAANFLAVAFALFAAPSLASECRSLAALEWLLGEWAADGAQSTFRESWTAVGPRTWEGRGVETSKADPAKSSTEVLRLVEMEDGVFYVAKVSHNELPIAFRLSECEAPRYTFVNPTHDFPRRLDYTRQGEDGLSARVSDGAGKGFTLEYRRAQPAASGADAVLAAEDARFAAMVRGDAEALHRWLAGELSYVHSTGEIENREQLIDSITSGRRRFDAVEPTERRVIFSGSGAALVQGLARFRVAAGATPLAFEARYLAAYGLRDGDWKLLAWQSLRLP